MIMKTYKIILKDGDIGTIDAEREEDLYKKLATGLYGVLPRRKNSNMIRYTPENIKEIIEELE